MYHITKKFAQNLSATPFDGPIDGPSQAAVVPKRVKTTKGVGSGIPKPPDC